MSTLTIPRGFRDGVQFVNPATGKLTREAVISMAETTSRATTGVNAATAAQADANNALYLISNISSDSWLSASEKPRLVLDYQRLLDERAGIDSAADKFAVSRTAYNDALTALTNYLNSLSPAYNDLTTDTEIVGATFRQKFTDVYLQRQLLLNALDARIVTTDYLAANAATDVFLTAQGQRTLVKSATQYTSGSDPASYSDFDIVLTQTYTATADCTVVCTVSAWCYASGTPPETQAGGPSFIYRGRIDTNQAYSTGDNFDAITPIDISSTTSLQRFYNVTTSKRLSMAKNQTLTFYFRICANDFTWMNWTLKGAEMRGEVIKR